MYKVFCDELPLYDLRSDELVLTSPIVRLKDNDAGSFSFTISPEHPYYNRINKMTSIVKVFHDDTEIFCGRATETTKDFYNQKAVYCEGELNFLCDSIQRPGEYHDQTVRGFLETLIVAHNSQVEIDKQFAVGMVTVTDSNDSIYRKTNYETTLTCINDKLVKNLGGHIRIRKVSGVRYIDYLATYPVTSTQIIEFGTNLLDYSENTTAADIATAVIPLGAETENTVTTGTVEGTYVDFDITETTKEKLTIKDVNGGVDYLYNQTAVNTYGWIFKTVEFSDVTLASNLKEKGQEYLNNIQYDGMTLDITAIDLSDMGVDISRIELLNLIRVKSQPHGLDRYFPVTEMEIPLDAPENSSMKLGSDNAVPAITTATKTQAKATNDVAAAVDAVPSKNGILAEARENATKLITAATHGHVVTTPDEQLIMDTSDTATATKVWRWNLNGLGYSPNGYNGTFGTAITMDGQIVGERIVAGSVSSEKLSVEYKSEVERQIEVAEANANTATATALQSYYTKLQVTTAIQNSADSVLLSAYGNAVSYTDARLQNYSTAAQIKVKTDAIESTVSQKLNSSEFTTKLTQSSYYVRLAWNNCSRYIQFEGGALNIYDYQNYKLMSLNSSGCDYYFENSSIGRLGTNSISGHPDCRGIVFDLERMNGYMTWAAKDSENANVYAHKMTYYNDDSIHERGLHFWCPTYAWGNLYINPNSKFGSFGNNDAMGIQTNTSIWMSTMSGNAFMILKDSGIDVYRHIDMHGWSIKNQSDLRMKNHIVESNVDGLAVLNALTMYEFDWMTDGTHEPIGIIAQQLQQVAPELVTEDAEDGHLSIKMLGLIHYIIKAIQQLSPDGYTKAPWTDIPYVDKKAFVAHLKSKKAVETVTKPEYLPIRK